MTMSSTPVQKLKVINPTMINNLLTLLEANLDKQNFKDELKDPAFVELLNEKKRIENTKNSPQIQESIKTNK